MDLAGWRRYRCASGSVLAVSLHKSANYAKSVGKWVITLTAPLWLLPVMVVAVLVLIFAGIHDDLWAGHKRRRPAR